MQTYGVNRLDDLNYNILSGNEGSTRFGGADGELSLGRGEEGG